MPCPSCGTEYRIPLEMLEDQIACKSCGRAFVPKSASQRRLKSRNNATPFIMGGAVLAFMVIGGFLITAGRGSGDAATNTTKAVRAVETGERNPRVRDVSDWLTALSEGNGFRLASNSDSGELVKFLGLGLLNGTTDDREKAVVQDLLNGEKAAFLRDCYVTSAKIEAEQAEASKGTVRAFLGVKPDAASKYAEQTAQFDLTFVFVEGRGRVTGWEAFYQPPPRKTDAGRKGPRPIKHEIIGSAQDVEREYGGKKEVVREAELKPLPHLEGTSPEVQSQIDAAIATLTDIEGAGGAANRASLKLKQLGKPAVPRLLNKMYELVTGQQDSLRDQDTVLRLRRVTQALEDLTGQRFGFNPSSVGNNPTAGQEYRMSALKQWYGWWADNHWRPDFDYAIDKGEDLFGDSPGKQKEDPKTRK